MCKSNSCGGFTFFRPLEDDDRVFFDKVIETLPKGVSHAPLAVATQLVSASKNFAFLCVSGPNNPGADDSANYNTLITADKSLTGVKVKDTKLI